MENASKALIIAGAILISILLISVAIMVISSTQGVQDQMESQMSSTEKSTFNAQFTNYSGSNRSSAQIKSLYERVVSSNASNSYKVNMYLPTSTGYGIATGALLANLSSAGKYNVYVMDTTGNGIYDKIVVSTTTLTQTQLDAI